MSLFQLHTPSNGVPPMGLVQRRYDGLTIGADKLALIASDVVDMYLVEAEIEEALDVLAMFFQVRRDEDAPFEVFRVHQLCDGRAGFPLLRQRVLHAL